MKEIDLTDLNLEKAICKTDMLKLRGGVEHDGTCGFHLDAGSQGDLTMCNLTRAEVDFWIMFYEGYGTIWWCCDSCGQTSYCGVS